MLEHIVQPLEQGEFLEKLLYMGPMISGLGLESNNPCAEERKKALLEWISDRNQRRANLGPG